jgi:BirA family biotin operon repressor/biotin-[acetyl-CoA-carboxylase] ligase
MGLPQDEWHLDTQHLGRRVLCYDRVDSTNTLAATFADDIRNDGLVLLADEQSAGRGQHGRSWQCPPRSGILLSVLLFPPPALRRPAILTAWAAVAVCETIRQATNLQARIKWPNDVLVQGRKVCGILIESKARPGGELYTVAGIGLNLNQTADDFRQAQLPDAGSLFLFTERRLERDDAARQLVHQLDEEYDRLCLGDLATLESCWKWRLGLLGKNVAAECHESTHLGRLRDLGWDAVELETGDGLLHLPPETVRHLRPV